MVLSRFRFSNRDNTVRRQKDAGKLHVGRWTSSVAALMPEQLRRDALAPQITSMEMMP
jgi:hypothetical protein